LLYEQINGALLLINLLISFTQKYHILIKMFPTLRARIKRVDGLKVFLRVFKKIG